MNRVSHRSLAALLLGLVAVAAMAQFGGGGRGGGNWRSGRSVMEPTTERGNVPNWPVDPKFSRDAFTFTRLKYRSSEFERSSYAWFTDYRDADLNLSFRLQQLTSMKVNPDPVVVEILDPKLRDYPWVFVSGAGNITLDQKEAATLRSYLLNGGFMMVDDFWGQDEWDGFYNAMKQVFPEFEPVDLPRSHPIFHCVYDIDDNLSLQTPNIGAASRSRETGITWEDNHGGGNTRDVHFRGIFDAKGRLMVFIGHNTDNGDGWEEETTADWFFHTFSENKNFPLGINIVIYAMTH